jgi:hypothetical protein
MQTSLESSLMPSDFEFAFKRSNTMDNWTAYPEKTFDGSGFKTFSEIDYSKFLKPKTDASF